MNFQPSAQLIALFCRLFYLLATLAVLVTASFPSTRTLLVHYGKLLNGTDNSPRNESILKKLLNWRVPKKRFAHFYAFGTVWTGLWARELWALFSGRSAPILHFILSSELESSKKVGNSDPARAMLAELLLLAQMARRLLESILVSKPSNALMHGGHYLVGFGFYLVTAIAVWIESAGSLAHCLEGTARCSRGDALDALNSKQVIFGILLFVYASYMQNVSHRILGDLRSGDSTSADASKPTYSLPVSGPFRKLDCPHYWFEVLIYSSLVFVAGGNRTLWYCLLWVVINLGTTAAETREWYQRTFGDRYPKRWRMVPFFW